MASSKEQFFEAQSFVVVGDTKSKGFPKITYGNLRRMGKTIYPVDLAGKPQVEGDTAYASVADIPGEVDAAIIEVRRRDTMDAVKQAVAAGIKDIWLHQGSHTGAIVSYCREQGVAYHIDGCAVMYTNNRLSYHSIHKRLWKLLGKY